MSERDATPEPIDSLALLADRVRRRVYGAVAGSQQALDRDAVAAEAGISRSLAAFHLDRLVDGGLLEATYRRRSGRTGPGAGRPAKFYRRAERAVEVSLPARRYDVAAALFADALERAGDAVAAVQAAAIDAGHAAARDVPVARRSGSQATSTRALLALLAARGFEPRQVDDGSVELGNCPFRSLTADHRQVTCAANLALVSALVGDFPGAGLVAERRDPAEPCCVELRRATGSRGPRMPPGRAHPRRRRSGS